VRGTLSQMQEHLIRTSVCILKEDCNVGIRLHSRTVLADEAYLILTWIILIRVEWEWRSTYADWHRGKCF